MFSLATSLATIKSLQIYGIAIVISMVVAVLIKALVIVTSSTKRFTKPAEAAQQKTTVPVVAPGIPDEVVAAITAAIAVVMGPHRILHIGETKHSWAREGRSAQHSHHPRY